MKRSTKVAVTLRRDEPLCSGTADQVGWLVRSLPSGS